MCVSLPTETLTYWTHFILNGPSQLGLATFQELSGHMCLVATALPKMVVESRISFQGAAEGQVGPEPNKNRVYS